MSVSYMGNCRICGLTFSRSSNPNTCERDECRARSMAEWAVLWAVLAFLAVSVWVSL